MKLDKSFIYNGDTVLKNQDLFQHPEIKNEITISHVDPNRIISFSDNFIKKSTFDTTYLYTVSFSCKTSDDKFFSKEAQVQFGW